MAALTLSWCLTAHSSNTNGDSTDNTLVSHRRLLEDVENLRKTLEMFQVSDFTVIGPSAWPKPSAKLHPDATPLLKPTFGSHRPDQDVVMAFAAEYGLNTYLSFVTTLRNTGFEGDIVFAVSKLDMKQQGVQEFFESQKGLVVYVIELQCFNAEGEKVDSVKGGMRVCQLPGLYQHKKGNIVKQLDPRPSRTVATTRYELYWIWAINYQPHSWIMLLDARDAFFQTNPFANVPREQVKDRPDGILYFFGVSSDAMSNATCFSFLTFPTSLILTYNRYRKIQKQRALAVLQKIRNGFPKRTAILSFRHWKKSPPFVVDPAWENRLLSKPIYVLW